MKGTSNFRVIEKCGTYRVQYKKWWGWSSVKVRLSTSRSTHAYYIYESTTLEEAKAFLDECVVTEEKIIKAKEKKKAKRKAKWKVVYVKD